MEIEKTWKEEKDRETKAKKGYEEKDKKGGIETV